MVRVTDECGCAALQTTLLLVQCVWMEPARCGVVGSHHGCDVDDLATTTLCLTIDRIQRDDILTEL